MGVVPAHSTALHESIALLLSKVLENETFPSLMHMRRQRVGGSLYAITTYRENSHRSYSGPTSKFLLLLVMHEVCATQQRNLHF